MKITNALSAPSIQHNLDSDSYYLPGSELSYQLIGKHNEGLLSLSEYLNYFDYLRVLTNKPFILDGQAGFGNPLNTYHSIQEMEKHGADIIILNDQKNPSHTNKANQIPASLNEFIGKVKAALDAHHPEYTSIWIKLDCSDQYTDEELDQRLFLISELGIKDIIIDPSTMINNSYGINIHNFNQETASITD
ncbi:hypothetical protein [Nicoliella lavandulae]|uniref:Carboxyvinyl-carboxyphosphonate phosphorylmutase n=1 Tax=Nicoliella lavandulae TaxID=3082954 RepID=A0ABU8SMX9_9LACO